MVAPNILVYERCHRVDDSDQDHQIGRKPMQLIDAVADCGVTRPEFRHGPYAEQIEAAIGRIDDAQHDHTAARYKTQCVALATAYRPPVSAGGRMRPKCARQAMRVKRTKAVTSLFQP
jgi:hypothetical protein